MTKLTNLIRKRNSQMLHSTKSLYAAISKVATTLASFSPESFKTHVNAQYTVWQLEDFSFDDLQLVNSYLDKKLGKEDPTEHYVVEDMQFGGCEIITKDDIYDVHVYQIVKEKVVDIEEFIGDEEEHDFDTVLDYIKKEMPSEFCQLCAFAIRYKNIQKTFEAHYTDSLKAYSKDTNKKKLIAHLQQPVAPITQEDIMEQRYEGRDLVPLGQ